MTQSAEPLAQTGAIESPVCYEQPLTERMRTFLRLEYLYRQLVFHVDRESEWESRAAVASLLDIIAILSRGDVRSDIIKELERQIGIFDRYQNTPDIDENRLGSVLRNLQVLRKDIAAVGPGYLIPVRENEFLNSIKHRSTIPGGTCEFDLPDYSHWLRRPYDERLNALRHWMKNLRPLCDSIAELLWLLRRSGQKQIMLAENGVFHHSIEKNSTNGLLRVSMVAGAPLFPEISGGHHRISVRFMEWSDVEMRAVQTNQSVEFELTIC
jgi:cell division protein ZapD